MDRLINALIALGTIAVAVLAIWGEQVRSWLAPPKLEVRPRGSFGHFARLVRGDANMVGPISSFYYHLTVTNLRPWLAVKECRVLLVGLERKGADGRFHGEAFPVPIQFVWAPAEANETYATVTKYRVFDFGRILKGHKFFEPILIMYPTSFDVCVAKGEAVRYHIEVDAANYASPKPTIFEVAWDGEWNDEREKMAQHLRIAKHS